MTSYLYWKWQTLLNYYSSSSTNEFKNVFLCFSLHFSLMLSSSHLVLFSFFFLKMTLKYHCRIMHGIVSMRIMSTNRSMDSTAEIRIDLVRCFCLIHLLSKIWLLKIGIVKKYWSAFCAIRLLFECVSL